MNPQFSQCESLIAYSTLFNIIFYLLFRDLPEREVGWMLSTELIAKYRTAIEIGMEIKAFNDSTLLSFLGSDLICFHALPSVCLNSLTFTKQANAVTCILQQGRKGTERQRFA